MVVLLNHASFKNQGVTNLKSRILTKGIRGCRLADFTTEYFPGIKTLVHHNTAP